MSKMVRVGVIGIGGMGGGHALRLVEGRFPNGTLTAVCDIRDERKTFAAEKLPDAKYFDDYKELIDSGLVDAILIATPHYLHPEIAIYGFEKNLHVLVEKPAGVYTKQVREMNEAAKKVDKVFCIMYNQRTNPYFAKLREMVQSGELGVLKRCNWIITTWYRTQSYYDSGTWRATWDGEGGGVLINQCPHNLDLWQWIFGMPNKIWAKCHYGKWHDIEVEDDVTAYAEYENGATAVFITTTGDCPGTNRLEITGDKAKVVFDVESNHLEVFRLSEPEREYCFTAKQGFARPDVEREVLKVPGGGFQHVILLQNFLDAITDGTPLIAPGEDGIDGLTISNAIHLSDWTGNQWVDLPLDEEKFLSLLNEKRKTSKVKAEAKTNHEFDLEKSQ